MSRPARSVFEALTSSAQRWPDNDFVQVVSSTAHAYGIPAQCLSYRDLYAQVLAWKTRYREAG